MAKIFVTDAEVGRIPLNIIRSLGRKNHTVYVGSEMVIVTPFFSKYCSKRIKYPSPSKEPNKYKEFMFNYVKKEKFDIIFPAYNESVLFFSKYNQSFNNFQSKKT